MTHEVTSDDFQQVAHRIENLIHRTPVMTSMALNRAFGTSIFFKCENLQKTGSFKVRGATNLVSSLTQAEAARGVVAHSSGNHAAALALAASQRGIPSFVVMPRDAPQCKQRHAQRYGAKVTLCEPTYAARQAACARLMEETGATLAHSSDDLRIIAGQGTIGLEFVEQVADLDIILAPVGGGGLTSGLALAMKTLSHRRPRIIAVEPKQADDTFRSLRAGEHLPPDSHTIADGLRTGLGQRPFAILSKHLDDIVTVSEESIILAMRKIWDVLKLVVEPSGAVPLAALLEHPYASHCERIGVVLTGGNLDLERVPWSSGDTPAAHEETISPVAQRTAKA